MKKVMFISSTGGHLDELMQLRPLFDKYDYHIVTEKDKMTKKEQAAKVGELIAQNAKEAGVVAVVFDRNGFLYHGRVKELADAARKGGLKF